jgi:translation elongation factor TU
MSDKPVIKLATLGHADHGKTTLTAAILNVTASAFGSVSLDTTKAINADIEAANQISYMETSSYFHYQTPSRHYLLSDLPTADDYRKALIGGGLQIDGGILVVDATNGPMPQTREHLVVCRRLNVPGVVVVLNKCDRINDAEVLDLLEMEMRELLCEYDYPGEEIPVTRCSAAGSLNRESHWENKIKELATVIDQWIPSPQTIAAQPLLAQSNFVAMVYMLSEQEGGCNTPIAKGDRLQFRFDDTDIAGEIELPMGMTTVMPGMDTEMQVSLAVSVEMRPGTYFTIRENECVSGVGFVF